MFAPESVNVPMPIFVSPPLPPMFPVRLSALLNGLMYAAAPETIVPVLLSVIALPVVCNVPPVNVIVPVPRLLAALICTMPLFNVVPPV